jgi:hypothetical protein
MLFYFCRKRGRFFMAGVGFRTVEDGVGRFFFGAIRSRLRAPCALYTHHFIPVRTHHSDRDASDVLIPVF